MTTSFFISEIFYRFSAKLSITEYKVNYIQVNIVTAERWHICTMFKS
nr:MAG TPA: hypothetical protein [Caudoviricetes sp.]